MADPASERYQRQVIAAIDAATSAFEISILEIIAERLGTIGDVTISELYAAMPEDIARIQKAIKDGTRNIEGLTDRIMSDMASNNDDWAAKYYEAQGIEQVAAANHPALKRTIDKSTDAIKRKVQALCRSTVFAIGDKRWSPVEQGYKRVVTNIAIEMTAGEITIDQAVRQAVKGMSNNGLRVMYQSGVTRNLQTAVRTNIMDAYRTAMSELREVQGEEFGADGVEVSAHALCAPDHQKYQGMQYSYERRRGYDLWEDIQNEPARPLVTGANCGHFVFPVVLGVSSPAYTRKELQELKRKSNEQVTFEGLSGKQLTMSRYDASQYQRKIETNIRKMKENTYLLEKAGLSEFAKMERKTQRVLSRRYGEISKDIGLTLRNDLTRIYVSK